MQKQKKRPHTIKNRIRSWLWKFLMEEPPEHFANVSAIKVDIDSREFAKLFRSVGQTTTDDISEA